MIVLKQAEEVDHYLFLLQDLVWRILQGVEPSHSLKKRFGELFKQGYPEELQLPRAYLALAGHLLHLNSLDIRPEQFPNGTALLDTLGWCESREIPEPTELAQLGVLWMILGVRLKNEVLLRAGLKVAVWHVHLLDQEGRPHLSIWSRARSFRPMVLSTWHHVLFTIAHRLTAEAGFAKLAEREWDSGAFASSLLVLVPSTAAPTVLNLYHPFAEEMTVGMMKFSNNEMSFMAHLSGWNSGLFSFHKKEVAILNGGPQVGAYDDLDQFGICRTWGVKQRPFQEIVWEKTAYHCQLKGWTQLFAASQWLELDARLQAGQLMLSCNHLSESMVLFLKCDQLVVGGKHALETGALEGYEGKAAALQLQGPSEKLLIHPDASLSMKVIPLAGGDHFWGADFLIAFPSSEQFRLEVK